ncbi:MAG: penicillin-binding protein activator LpoB [Flavobacteriales bacterium]|nr:penicillin-binding protein activator LpoB [Flavobacteriales bacterium]MBT6133133.1 penicillin-binding protein activator LpoB [Flavobacteriales bacterium]MBT6383660.1 penicillin-binding protein activator LpoB [Flavobacteriales bacterium]
MILNRINLLAFGMMAILVLSCQNRRVQRVDPNETIDLSGRWNDTDSKMTSSAMIEQVLSGPWLINHFEANNNEKPVVIVGLIKNNSHEHINPETFCKDLERSFITSQRVRLVQSGEKREEVRQERSDQQNYSSKSTMKKWGLEMGADYMLQGTLNSTIDQYKKDKVIEYQIDLELTNMETNEIVWIGDKKIKKFIKD